MKYIKSQKIIPVLLTVVSCLLFVNFLWWHYRLGMTRYFDVDEFAHLKWAYALFSGRKPYVDFLSFFPPGYHWFLMPLFFFGNGVTPFLLGRLGEFGIFTALVGATIGLFWMVRKNLWAGLLAGAILAFLPLPFDKFLEVRPDTLAILLVVLGIIFQIRWMRREGKEGLEGLGAGLCYALSLLVLPKMLPNVLVGIAVAILWAVTTTSLRSLKELRKEIKKIIPFLLGFFGPLFFFGLWCLTLGHLDLVFYSLTKLPIESNKISQIFFMSPDLFFYPNGIFYGENGWSGGLIVNHILWVVGGLVGIYRLVTPLLGGREEGLEGSEGLDGKNKWTELLIAGNFIVQVIFYVSIVPLKHSQYLIPIAVFVAWYVADGVAFLWRRVEGIGGKESLPAGRQGLEGIRKMIFAGLFLVGSVYLYQTNLLVESPKLSWTNREALEELKKIYTTIPTSEYILDLDGRTLYYKDPYYACCIPFGQFAPYLSRPLPPLAQALEQTKTKYIYEGQLKRVGTLLPQDQTFINAHFTQVSDVPGLLKRAK